MEKKSASALAGRRLYNRVWTRAKIFYDPDRLTDWHSWKGRFDDSIDCEQTAVTYAEQMLASLGDGYTRLLTAEEAAEKTAARAVEESNVIGHLCPNNIGYVRIIDFVRANTAKDAQTELQKLVSADGIIVDLRGNSGGIIDQALHCSHLLLEKACLMTLIWTAKSGKGIKQEYYLQRDHVESIAHWTSGHRRTNRRRRYNALVAGKPLLVMIDEGTASAAELLTSILRENADILGYTCILVGQPTYGKAINQERFKISPQVTLQISASRFTSAKDRWFGDAKQTICDPIVPDTVLDWSTVPNPMEEAGKILLNAIHSKDPHGLLNLKAAS